MKKEAVSKDPSSKVYVFPVALTLMNAACGVISIFFAISGNFFLSVVFMLSAVVFDGIDGKFARHLKQVSVLGKELDSLCDIVSFGVAPAVLAFETTKLLYSGAQFGAMIIVYVLFVCAGAFRLARFNVKNLDYFEGMPITMNGIIVPLLYIGGLEEIYPVALLVSAILMVSTLRVKKMR